jgi:PAS domain S-box-containing protein
VWSAVVWAVIGLVSAVSVVVGVRRHRPLRSGPWRLLAASIVALAVGDVAFALGADVLSDVSYLAMFPLVTVSLMYLTRGGVVLVERARLLDLLAFACAALLVVWVFVVGAGGGLGPISAADTIGDLLLVAVAGRLAVAAGRNPSAILIVLGAVGMLVSDVVYPLAPGHPAELGYMVLYLAWGAAALHPSMVRLTAPAEDRPTPWRGRCSVLLGVSVGTPPFVLLVEAMTGGVRDGVVIAVSSGLTIVLAITRLGDSLEQHSRALGREQGLREASAALVGAADVPEVDVAVRAAVRSLLPPGTAHRVVFATDDRELALRALPSAVSEGHTRSWWLSDADPYDTTAGFESTLVCPLWLEPLAVARPRGGALVLMGPRDALSITRDALEVLAGQAALALDRIALVAAVSLRDSDHYLRAVIQSTSEIMLVTDDDHRIRYASPALSTLLGAELPPFALVSDLVHPDDRGMLDRALDADEHDDPAGDRIYCTLQRPDGTQVPVAGTLRDLRRDRLVQGFVITLEDLSDSLDRAQFEPYREGNDDVPAWVNRRSVRDKFRY